MSERCLRCAGSGYITPDSDKKALPNARVYFQECPECCNGMVDDEHAKQQREDRMREQQDNGQFGVGS